ncbi:DNA polymerase III subunit chi, partial [Salmonella enterica]|uniref:DNA polymerase III subunit chi n=1 Tax=Salmonella enterica TaxID=28901 RepID=UPI00329710D9
PKLVEKIFFQYKKLVIFCPEQALIKNLDDVLWSYTTKHFLPHGTMDDPLPELQPIYITNSPQNPNNADCLLVAGSTNLDTVSFKKIYY